MCNPTIITSNFQLLFANLNNSSELDNFSFTNKSNYNEKIFVELQKIRDLEEKKDSLTNKSESNYNEKIFVELQKIRDLEEKKDSLTNKSETWLAVFLGVAAPFAISKVIDIYRKFRNSKRSRQVLINEFEDIKQKLNNNNNNDESNNIQNETSIENNLSPSKNNMQNFSNSFFITSGYDDLVNAGFILSVDKTAQDYLSQLYYKIKKHNEYLNYLNHFEDNFFINEIDEKRKEMWKNASFKYTEYLENLETDIEDLVNICEITLNKINFFKRTFFEVRRLTSSIWRK